MPLIHLRKLPSRFNVIMFLTVHDPEEELKAKVGLQPLMQSASSNFSDYPIGEGICHIPVQKRDTRYGPPLCSSLATKTDDL